VEICEANLRVHPPQEDGPPPKRGSTPQRPASVAPSSAGGWTIFLALILLAGSQAIAAQESPYTVPAAVFVGDRAILVVPVESFPGQGGQEVPNPALFGRPDLDIHRIVLERRAAGARLVIEFTAFVPGPVRFPVIEIAGVRFPDLSVQIASILGPSELPILAPPEPPLAVPGTAFLVYGTMAGLILFLLLLFLALSGGRTRFSAWLAHLRRRRRLAAMLAAERRLRKGFSKGILPRELLDGLSREFRNFLSGLSGEDCLAMTAAELGRLAFPESPTDNPEAPFLGTFFARCDRLRFGRDQARQEEVAALLDELRAFLVELQNPPKPKPETPAPEGGAA